MSNASLKPKRMFSKRDRYAESTTLKVLIMAQIHEKTVTHYKKDAHKLAGDRE